MKDLIRRTIQSAGFDIVKYHGPDRRRNLPPDITEADRTILNAVIPYSLTSVERLTALIAAVRFIVRNGIPGAIAECGVWKGGSMMAAAMALLDEGDSTRELYLYDTFEGMSEPTEYDKSFDGMTAADQLAETPKGEGFWCYSPLEEVEQNLVSTGYPRERLHFIKGKVEDTIPQNNPPELAVLRLDTDWYESTKHELEHLFPLLVPRGFLIIDDYGYWEGARKAVDEFVEANPVKYFLHRIDSTGRLLIK